MWEFWVMFEQKKQHFCRDVGWVVYLPWVHNLAGNRQRSSRTVSISQRLLADPVQKTACPEGSWAGQGWPECRTRSVKRRRERREVWRLPRCLVRAVDPMTVAPEVHSNVRRLGASREDGAGGVEAREVLVECRYPEVVAAAWQPPGWLQRCTTGSNRSCPKPLERKKKNVDDVLAKDIKTTVCG